MSSFVLPRYQDDPAARPDIAAWCRMRGHDYVGESAAGESKPEQVQNDEAPAAETRQALIDIRHDLESLYRMLKD